MKKLLMMLGITTIVISCKKNSNDLSNSAVPTVSTVAVSDIGSTAAIAGGTITSNGGSSITTRGVCYNTTSNPSVANTTVECPTDTTTFTVSLIGLSANTTYYAKAYATNSKGTAYGNEVSFTTANTSPNNSSPITDYEGNSYRTVQIRTQTWMQENLNTAFFNNGDAIPEVENPLEWPNLTTPAWCYYEASSANGLVYGRLYNWYAATDPRGIAPAGLHLPNDADWNLLYDQNGGFMFGGAQLKEEGTEHWSGPNLASNATGFTGLPGGLLTNHSFAELHHQGTWWSADGSGAYAHVRWVVYNWRNAIANSGNYTASGIGVGLAAFKGSDGVSIRLIKD